MQDSALKARKALFAIIVVTAVAFLLFLPHTKQAMSPYWGPVSRAVRSPYETITRLITGEPVRLAPRLPPGCTFVGLLDVHYAELDTLRPRLGTNASLDAMDRYEAWREKVLVGSLIPEITMRERAAFVRLVELGDIYSNNILSEDIFGYYATRERECRTRIESILGIRAVDVDLHAGEHRDR